MSTPALLGIAAVGIALLLILIIRFQVHAFIAMMLVSFLVALAAGLPIGDIIPTLISGMGGTLGSVAILVALGAMLGRVIEVSGGAGSMAQRFTQLLGPTRVPAALTAAALVLSIPVFFDVGFIILVPIIYGFCKAAKVDPVKFGLPVAGIMLAVHVVVPPHPGIVGGATVLQADIGWITLIGLAICVVLAVVSQYVSKFLNRKRYAMLPTTAAQFEAFDAGAAKAASGKLAAPGVGVVLTLILVPLLLIMLGTTGATLLPKGDPMRNALGFIGSPVFALMVAIGLAFWLIARQQGWSKERTNEVMESALPPAATVILVTGAGGVFAKVLTATGIGAALSQSITAAHLPLILAGFVISLALRAAQGSATVAILTTCGLLAQAVTAGGYSAVQVALLTVAIGFGGLGLSHVNDSGFWIVTRYLGLSVADGLRSWTVLTTVLGVAGFLMTAALWALVA
ncbi:GntP family transporter [Variovorax guangxiensis]|uniref:GntP family transporter n=1 Tax=Variovorax guangxiensis TaxID=1775474 RepID=A0A502DWJ3_9BURK|nr:GntP family transporter [Variovorax guangxiensis]RZI63528.1 MAG: GntP family transporter [Variovorax sp.]TPG24787.1 GntP family transporter [Variovorax ginsengisoli]TPG29039.1 GntP family transporter [Variovorax guangxiensis]